ncbi:MAG: cupredoxin domain-containing protein [Myxococcales bacterium]
MKRDNRAVGLGVLGLAVCGAALMSAHALAVDVRGSVKGGDSKPKAVETVRGPYWHEWNGFIEPKKSSADLSREVAVVLIGDEAMKDAVTVTMQDGTLSPSTVVMQKGSALRVRNDDDFTHQLFAEGLSQFDAVETSAGQARQLQVDQEGSFPILDRLAPYVKGHLHVLPKISKLANPQSDGTFKFEDVAPGNYTLKVFRGGAEVSSTTLEVADKREFVIDPISVEVNGK